MSLQMYSRNSDLIVGGCTNGLINVFDIRTSNGKYTGVSSYDHSHTGPVFDVSWLQSKTHSEIVSVSTDGKAYWWDTRQLGSCPIDTCDLVTDTGTRFGATCIEWQQEAGPTKYLVGTEEGVGIALNKKPKKAIEVGGWFGVEEKGGFGRHFAPIVSIKRNIFHPKFFMTVGDTCVKLWLEELKMPLVQTASSPCQLTCGGWSPSRASVFFTGRFDGCIDFYDYSYRMDGLAYSHKIGDTAISSISAESKGRFIAAGDVTGSITLVKLSDELALPVANEKAVMGAILEREQHRERNLDTIRKQQFQAIQQQHTLRGHESSNGKRIDQEQYIGRETDWLSQVGLSQLGQSDISIQPGSMAHE
jgi:dynein intermediate chain 2